MSFTADETDDLLESAAIIANQYITANSSQYIHPTFHTNVVNYTTQLLCATLRDVYFLVDLTDQIKPIVEKGIGLFYKNIAPPRSSGNTFIRKTPNVDQMRAKITYLQNIPQPEQRTPEWYEFRSRYLTASSIWKTFISDSTRNQLIMDKCKPLNIEKYGTASLDSPLHWGVKYEPLSIQIYETLYKTHVSDFGCLPHRTLDFLAASPDGINTLAISPLYGRMLEVKNIVNREITGIPKTEYWIQTQVQMEVCDLNECDFLETRFVEYADEDAYLTDASASEASTAAAPSSDAAPASAAPASTAEKFKGLIMLFMNEGKPLYEYAPLRLDPNEIQQWQDEIMEKNSTLTWIKNIYWKLDQLSCVLILRNKLWFRAAEPKLKEIWAIIQTEKVTGYEHRKPKKSNTLNKAKKLIKGDDLNIEMTNKCFITIDTAEAEHVEAEHVEAEHIDIEAEHAAAI
jgi:putative phage-type endonuclease